MFRTALYTKINIRYYVSSMVGMQKSRDRIIADFLRDIAVTLASFMLGSWLSFGLHLGDWVDQVQLVPLVFWIVLFAAYYFHGRAGKQHDTKTDFSISPRVVVVLLGLVLGLVVSMVVARVMYRAVMPTLLPLLVLMLIALFVALKSNARVKSG